MCLCERVHSCACVCVCVHVCVVCVIPYECVYVCVWVCGCVGVCVPIYMRTDVCCVCHTLCCVYMCVCFSLFLSHTLLRTHTGGWEGEIFENFLICMYVCMYVCMYGCIYVWELGYFIRMKVTRETACA